MPLLPKRICLKMMGPGVINLIAKAVISIKGEKEQYPNQRAYDIKTPF